MATLEIEFNCMILFAPDERGKVVHVLMPSTHGHQHGAGPIDPHLVRMCHRSFNDPHHGRPMEGWELVLGGDGASADTTLVPEWSRPRRDEIVDLREVTGRHLPRALLGDDQKVVSRVTLRAGWMKSVVAEAIWDLRRPIFMASKATWMIDNVSEDRPLTWIRRGATTDPPIESLRDLGPDLDGVYRISVYHTTEAGLPPVPAGGTLDPAVIREHFRAFYLLYDITNPSDDMLPTVHPLNKLNCIIAKSPLEAA